MTKQTVDIRKAVRVELTRRHWTIYHLAKEMGKDGLRMQDTLYSWLNGNHEIGSRKADKVLAVLGLTVTGKEDHG